MRNGCDFKAVAYNNMHTDHTCWYSFSSLVLMLTENMHTSYNVW